MTRSHLNSDTPTEQFRRATYPPPVVICYAPAVTPRKPSQFLCPRAAVWDQANKKTQGKKTACTSRGMAKLRRKSLVNRASPSRPKTGVSDSLYSLKKMLRSYRTLLVPSSQTNYNCFFSHRLHSNPQSFSSNLVQKPACQNKKIK